MSKDREGVREKERNADELNYKITSLTTKQKTQRPAVGFIGTKADAGRIHRSVSR